MDFVYLITYKKGDADGRFALEVTQWSDVILAILSLGEQDAREVEVFRARPVQ